MLAVLRFDSSPDIGAGHAARCHALAAALSRYGWDVVDARQTSLNDDPDALGLHGDSLEEAQMLAERVPAGCDLLIVDHYDRAIEFERACRPWAKKILAIDDLSDRRHEVDFLLDPAPGRAAENRHAVAAGAETFFGAAYAPLRHSFVRHRHSRDLPVTEPLTKIFVGFGGSDPTGLTARTLAALRALGAGEQVIAVLGSLAKTQHARRMAAGNDFVRLVINPTDIAATMSECQIAIGAGGVSALERCALGLPSIAIVAAENQRETVHALAEAGAAVAMDDPGENGFAAVLEHCLGVLRKRRKSIAASALSVCDGLGAVRVAASVGGPPLRQGGRLNFRPVTAADSEALLRWQTLPSIRRYSRNPNPPTASEHESWLARALADPARVFELASSNGEPAGVLRLDRKNSVGDRDRYEISIYVLPDCQGRGVGKAMLAFARCALPWAEFVAQVLPGNEASHRLFSACGYRNNDGLYIQEPAKEAA